MRDTRRYVLRENCRTWKVSQRPLFGGALGSSDYRASYDGMIVLWPRIDVPWLDFFISLLNCTFSPPHYFPIFTSSRLQILFKWVLILVTTPSSCTRFGLVDMDEGAGSRTAVDREWHTSSIYIPPPPSFSYLELPSVASICWIINWWSCGTNWAWLNVREPGVFVKDENITTRALKITVSELTFESGTSRVRRGMADPPDGSLHWNRW
jgi:hypothetical protein